MAEHLYSVLYYAGRVDVVLDNRPGREGVEMSFTVNGAVAPLFFKYRELLAGDGFLAGVTTTGRVILVQEQEGEWWMYGVQPGGIAEWGETPDAAHAAFRRAFHAVLIDIMNGAEAADDFKRGVDDFVNVVNVGNLKIWEAAVEAVRNGSVNADGLARWPSSTPVEVEIVIMDQPRKEANVLDDDLQHAIAA